MLTPSTSTDIGDVSNSTDIGNVAMVAIDIPGVVVVEAEIKNTAEGEDPEVAVHNLYRDT